MRGSVPTIVALFVRPTVFAQPGADPQVGNKPLDKIPTHDVQRLKHVLGSEPR